jgi:hypothetical protein
LRNPAIPLSLWNLSRAKEASRKTENSGWRDDSGQQKTHPRLSMDEDGFSLKD